MRAGGGIQKTIRLIKNIFKFYESDFLLLIIRKQSMVLCVIVSIMVLYDV